MAVEVLHITLLTVKFSKTLKPIHSSSTALMCRLIMWHVTHICYAQVTLWRGHYELTGEYEDLLRIRIRLVVRHRKGGKVWSRGWNWKNPRITSIRLPWATIIFSQEHLVSVKNIDEDQTNFVEVCTI